MRVPAPPGLSSSKIPSSASTRSRNPPRPGAVGGLGAADAVVGDLHDEHLLALRDANRRGRRLRVLEDVGQRLGDDEVRGALDERRPALGVVDGEHRHRNRRPAGERAHGGGKPLHAQDLRVQSARELAELLVRGVQLDQCAVEELLRLVGIACAARARRGGRRARR